MRTLYLLLYYIIARNIPTLHWIGRKDPGLALRNLCAKKLFKFCGENIYIGYKAYFGNGHSVELGDYSAIGINCHVPNNIKIGQYVMMGPNCYFLSNDGNHRYDDLTRPMIFQGKITDKKRISIGDDVWLGRQCLILSGKEIKSHSIIAAGSVVCKDVEENTVVGGNPIKLIRYR